MSIEALAYAKQFDLGAEECAQARLLLYVIAENTFNDTFVCRLCQDQLAYEAGQVSERTVRRYLERLEGARVIIRRERWKSNGGGKLPDDIRIRGFKRDYLRRNPKARAARNAAKSIPDKLAGLGGQSGQFDRFKADNRCPVQSGQQVSGIYKDSRTSNPVLDYSPSLPHDAKRPEGGGGYFKNGLPKRWRTAEATIAELVADARLATVVERVIAPLISSLVPPKDADPSGYLRQMAAKLAEVPAEALDGIRRDIEADRAQSMPTIAQASKIIEARALAAANAEASRAAMAALDLPEPSAMAEATWLRIRSSFAALKSPAADATYLADARALGLVGPARNVTLIVPSPGLKTGLMLACREAIAGAVRRETGREVEIVSADEYAARMRAQRAAI